MDKLLDYVVLPIACAIVIIVFAAFTVLSVDMILDIVFGTHIKELLGR